MVRSSFASVTALVVLTTLLLGQTAVWAEATANKEAAAKVYAEGEALLRKADFDGASKCFADAAKQDRDNAKYRDQFMLVRRVMKTREAISAETNAEKWRQMATGLRSFYYQYDLHQPIYDLAKEMHARDKNVRTASYVAEACLQLGKHEEAVETLKALKAEEMTPESKVILGIALAKLKKTEEAKSVEKTVTIPEKVSTGFLFAAARLKVLTGDAAGGVSTLVRAFENTPAAQLVTFKAYAAKHEDFAPIAETEAFAAALKTESKVVASGCSGGSSCGSCPSSGGCGSAETGH